MIQCEPLARGEFLEVACCFSSVKLLVAEKKKTFLRSTILEAQPWNLFDSCLTLFVSCAFFSRRFYLAIALSQSQSSSCLLV